MLKAKLIVLLSLLCSIAFVGCESKDGDWDPIEITVNGNRYKKSTFKVAQSGGEYKLFSKNYGELWLNEVKENGNKVWPKDYEWSDYKKIHLATEWYDVHYDESGNIVVSISPKEAESEARSLTFMVECGDAFGNITLLQE